MRVFVTYAIPGPALERAAREHTLAGHLESTLCPREEILSGLPGCDALLCTISDRIDGEVIGAGDDLKVISNYGAGVDHIDLEVARQKGILVGHTPGVLTESTADFTFALILAAARRVVAGDGVMRRREFTGWQPDYFLGRDVHGATLGIVGLGSIGKAVARRARAFDMTVLYTGRRRLEPAEESELGVRFSALDDLIAASDFVSLHCPLTGETRHLIDERRLGLFRPRAFLINTARGPVVDEKALVRALQSKALAGAALDVFEREPEVEGELLALPQVTLAPHLGSATLETRSRMSELAVDNLLAGLSGEALPHRVAE
ncbi:MAG: D-glycerate dehydrogenase [Planctomycetota bacterium]